MDIFRAERTQALTAKCNEDFDILKAVMRDIKDRYFKIPPLDNAALAAFGLKPKDSIRRGGVYMYKGCYPLWRTNIKMYWRDIKTAREQRK
jgi:hypothetical protein